MLSCMTLEYLERGDCVDSKDQSRDKFCLNLDG